MYRDGTLADYIADAASGKPAPGGGSIAAMVAVLGTTMGSMAANFTLGRKKFESVQPRVARILADLDARRQELLLLVDEDVAAYSVVGQAYALPRDTDPQKAVRRRSIQDALKRAMDVPLRTMNASWAALEALDELVDIANPNLLSDVAVAAVVLEAGLRAAQLNVEVNLADLKDDVLVAETRSRIQQLAARAAAVHDSVLNRARKGRGV